MLSKKIRTLMDAFDDAAQSWGWEADQGVINVQSAKKTYQSTKEALERAIAALELRYKKLQEVKK
jgi:hypothetical protein